MVSPVHGKKCLEKSDGSKNIFWKNLRGTLTITPAYAFWVGGGHTSRLCDYNLLPYNMDYVNYRRIDMTSTGYPQVIHNPCHNDTTQCVKNVCNQKRILGKIDVIYKELDVYIKEGKD